MTAQPEPAPTFAEFVAARSGPLLRSAWLLTGDVQRAEDLVQTALAKVWPRWDKLARDSGGSPEAYVRRVLYTTYVSWWRRRWRDEISTEHLPETPERADATEQIATRDVVRQALALLPRGQRAVLVLRYFEDLSEAETAAVLGVSTGTVKSQTSRALARLRTVASLADLVGLES